MEEKQRKMTKSSAPFLQTTVIYYRWTEEDSKNITPIWEGNSISSKNKQPCSNKPSENCYCSFPQNLGELSFLWYCGSAQDAAKWLVWRPRDLLWFGWPGKSSKDKRQRTKGKIKVLWAAIEVRDRCWFAAYGHCLSASEQRFTQLGAQAPTPANSGVGKGRCARSFPDTPSQRPMISSLGTSHSSSMSSEVNKLQ